MNALRTATILLAMAAAFCSCRSWPEDASPLAPPLAEGTYVGSGTLGGGGTNVLMAVTGPDTSGRLGGAMRYRSQIISLEDIYRVMDTDTLWFRYRRDNILYRAWALLGGNGLSVHFVEPAAIPTFRLNREIAGYNMSGLWCGLMSSTEFGLQSDATMTMDQQGQSFYGTVEAVFLQTARFDLNNGVASDGSYHLTGTMTIAASSYSVLFVGAYLARDTVRGNWNAGANGAVDRGEFWFYRSFD